MLFRSNNDDKPAEADAAGGPKDRATVITSTMEIVKVTTSVSADDVAIPAGFKEEK